MARTPYNEQENRDYWRKRHLKLKAKQIESTEEYQRQLYKRLGYIERSFEKELKHWYKRYAANNNNDFEQASNILKDIDTMYFDLTLDEFKSKALKGGYDQLLNNQYFKERVTRLKSLQKDFENKLSDEAVNEAEEMKKVLANQYQGRYYETAYTIDMERKVINHNLAKINDEAAKVIVSKAWQGSDFSKRIWNTYRNELPSQLTDSLLKSALRGDSYTHIMKNFKQRFTDVKRKNIKRLVVTEMGHVDETATSHAYEREGLEKYEYVATLERRTCEQCAGLDGKIFNLKDKVVALNYPLMHPYCRCTTIPYIEDNPKINSRYDQENKKIIKNISYEDWKDNVLNPTFSKDDIRAANDYKSSKSYIINDKLRNNYSLTKEDEMFINNFDKVLDKLPTYQGKPLNRSLYFNDSESGQSFLNKYIKDKIITEKQYISSATDIYNSEDNVRMIINHNNLAKDFRKFNPNENEIIFKRNTKFYVKNRYYKNNRFYIEVNAYE